MLWNSVDFSKGSCDLTRLTVLWDEEFISSCWFWSPTGLLPILIKICSWHSLFSKFVLKERRETVSISSFLLLEVANYPIWNSASVKIQLKSFGGEPIFSHFIVALIIISISEVNCGLYMKGKYINNLYASVHFNSEIHDEPWSCRDTGKDFRKLDQKKKKM